MKKWVYELIYRFPFVPIEWIFGHHTILEALLERGHIEAGRAIDLGCGEGSNAAIFLATQGFEVTGVDFSPTAIRRARHNALIAGVEANFVEDDLTDLRHPQGTFDLLVDFGALNDMNDRDRDLYVQNLLPLAHPGSRYLLGCFTKKITTGEIEYRFGEHFKSEPLPVASDTNVAAVGFVYHWMLRKPG